MHFILIGHQFENDIQTITQVFYPNEKFIRTNKIMDEGITAVSVLNKNTCTAFIYENGVRAARSPSLVWDGHEVKELKRLVKLSMFEALKQKTDLKTPWGILTGIRPAKIARQILTDCDEETVFSRMSQQYRVSREKIALCISVAKAESDILKANDGRDASLYIGIPFCPTRCLYCSFTSYPIAKYEQYVSPYLAALEKELKLTAQLIRDKRLDTVYIGGGTPTVLDNLQLEWLLETIHRYFDMDASREFTVEAGRPDTLNREKLDILKRYGATRISINPQTMDDATLMRIGRGHTCRQFLEAYESAVAAGHRNINLDLILGLPGENAGNVESTFRRIEELSPQNITVHTLAVKRASRLKENLSDFSLSLARMEEMEEMLEIANRRTKAMNMKPYYLYRQKNMLGNFENVGYSLDGYEGIYNVQIMEERQTVLAVGAGAITKAVDWQTDRIDRVFNVKNVEQYILRIDEMLERKLKYFSKGEM